MRWRELRADGKPVDADARRRRRGTRDAEGSGRDGSASATPSASSATSRRATVFRKAACWWFRRAAIPMPYVVIEAARGRNSDGRRQCRRHPGNLRTRTPTRCSPPASSARWRTRSRSRWTIPTAHGPRAKSLRERIFHAFLAEGDGRRRVGRLPRRICESLTVLYRR